MQALCLELATMGDLKLVERPQNYTLAPGATRLVRANIKASQAVVPGGRQCSWERQSLRRGPGGAPFRRGAG
jgi:hypothetical protein